MNESLLAKIPLFNDLPLAELRHLVETLGVLEVPMGTIVFREGEVGDSFYVVVEGELEIVMAVDSPEELLLNTLGPGEYLGEMSLLMPGGVRTASVRARSAAVLLVMTRQEFNELLLRQPMLAYSMVRVLSERLDSTNDATFHDLTEKNRQLQKAYNELKDAQEQLIEKERLERELQVAAGIQMSILPDVLPETSGFDFGGLVVPAHQVGGDFYDVFPVGTGKIGVLIGDVADKGVPSAIFMARAHALIVTEAAHGFPAGKVMREANRHITHLEKSTQFVTTLFRVLDCKTGEFAYARAGHEPPLLLSPNGQVERLPFKTGMALGAVEDIVLDENTIWLTPGSTLLFYTDGLTDCRNPEGEPFGLERIQSALTGLRGLSAQEVCGRLLSMLKEYQLGSPQDDDVTLVAVHARQSK
jgi:serine phosphatase RsbU (regulator of sigma subunit)